jgi:hypothetical protein
MQRVAAELLGSLLLAATVIGSGIMAGHLAAGNAAIALLANTGATVAVLAVLMQLFGPISGAHFNPPVSLVQARSLANASYMKSTNVRTTQVGLPPGSRATRIAVAKPPPALSSATHRRRRALYRSR